MRTLAALLLLIAMPAWGAPEPEPTVTKLVLDLSKAKVSDLARTPGLTSLTLTGPYDSSW